MAKEEKPEEEEPEEAWRIDVDPGKLVATVEAENDGLRRTNRRLQAALEQAMEENSKLKEMLAQAGKKPVHNGRTTAPTKKAAPNRAARRASGKQTQTGN